MRQSSTATVIGAALLLLILCCTRDMPSEVPVGEFVRPDEPFSPIRYWDRDLVSLNDRCPVSQTQLNPAIDPIYVNGRPVGFC